MDEKSQCLRFADAEESESANEGLVPFTCRSQLGVVVPMPRLLDDAILNDSVRSPLTSVENASCPFPVVVAVEVMMPVRAPVVVPRPVVSCALKERRDAVEVPAD